MARSLVGRDSKIWVGHVEALVEKFKGPVLNVPMPPEQKAMLEPILIDPRNTDAKMVYADYVQDYVDWNEGESLRRHIQLNVTRDSQLRLDYDNLLPHYCQTRHGFVFYIEITLMGFLNHWKRLFTEHPIELIKITDIRPMHNRRIRYVERPSEVSYGVRSNGIMYTQTNYEEYWTYTWQRAESYLGIRARLPQQLPAFLFNVDQNEFVSESQSGADFWATTRLVDWARNELGLPQFYNSFKPLEKIIGQQDHCSQE